MDTGGWLDVFRVCQMLQDDLRLDYTVTVNELYALLKGAEEDKRYELAIARWDEDRDEYVRASVARRRDRSNPHYARYYDINPFKNKHQGPLDIPKGGGVYVGIRAVQGHSIPGVLEDRLMMPISDRYIPMFERLWHATTRPKLSSIIEGNLLPGRQGCRHHV